MNNYFDINKIINKGEAKDRVIIFFDEVLNGLIKGKRKFSETQIESLSNSFKSNLEKDLFNGIQHDSLYLLFSITQIEKEIFRIEYLSTFLRFYNSSQDDKCFIDYLIAKSLEKVKDGKNIYDEKLIKTLFKELSKQINEMCFLSFGDEIIKKFIEKNSPKNDEPNNLNSNKDFEDKQVNLGNVDNNFKSDEVNLGNSKNSFNDKINLEDEKIFEETENNFYHQKFANLFTNSIKSKTNLIRELLNELKKNYQDFELKFESIEIKIKELEEVIEGFESRFTF